jgi:hypothetical protein
MKAPLQNSRGRMTYNGRLDSASLYEWARSPAGARVIEDVAPAIRFPLLGRMRSARRRVWRQLASAARSFSVIEAVRSQANEYVVRLDPIVFAHDLPRVSVDLRRLVVVPRLFANAESYRALYTALRDDLAFAALHGGEALREWFVLTMVGSMERAAASARPSTRSPLHVSSDWMVVAVNEQFEWRVPFEGPPWPGHYYLLEITSSPLTRAVRNRVDGEIANLERSLPSLPRARRNEILRQAGSSLEQLLASSRSRAASV